MLFEAGSAGATCSRFFAIMCRVVMDGAASELAANEDVKEFYLGIASGARRSFKDVKHYRRRKRWLA